MTFMTALQMTVTTQIKVIGIVATTTRMMPLDVIPVLSTALTPPTLRPKRPEVRTPTLVRAR